VLIAVLIVEFKAVMVLRKITVITFTVIMLVMHLPVRYSYPKDIKTENALLAALPIYLK